MLEKPQSYISCEYLPSSSRFLFNLLIRWPDQIQCTRSKHSSVVVQELLDMCRMILLTTTLNEHNQRNVGYFVHGKFLLQLELCFLSADQLCKSSSVLPLYSLAWLILLVWGSCGGLKQFTHLVLSCTSLMNEVVHTSPTIGSNVEEIVLRKTHFLMWDIGGQETLRSTWNTYFSNTEVSAVGSSRMGGGSKMDFVG